MSTDNQPTVSIHIGNGDNRLTQQRWAQFCTHVASVVDGFVGVYADQGARLVGAWYALPNSEYQSAVFTLQLPRGGTAGAGGARTELIDQLRWLAYTFGQDSIGCQWSPGTELLNPAAPRSGS